MDIFEVYDLPDLNKEDIAEEKWEQERNIFGDNYDSFSKDVPNLDNKKE
ncbi:hypothetical protein K8R14_01410 [bacterium]|nr:hypothetical protein [bacterium]